MLVTMRRLWDRHAVAIIYATAVAVGSVAAAVWEAIA